MHLNVGVRIALVVAVVALALVAGSTAGRAAESQCGAVTEVSLSDPISGGSVSIDSRVFRVGGLGRNVQLPPVTEPGGLQTLLHVGVRACVEGDFRVLADGSVDVTNGRVFLDPASLPNTSTEGSSAPLTLVAVGVFALVIALTATWLGIHLHLIQARTP